MAEKKKVPNILTAALEYGKRGWRVFPILAVTASGGCECADGLECDKAGKHPAIAGWNKEASTNPAQIEEWWGKRPDRGVGIATGEESGITVLDVDGEEGVEELGKLSVGSGMPPTPCVQSRPGRYHYYFQYIKGVKSNSKKLGAHLDTRGDGGYVVAPPSRHATGSTYSWLQAPDRVALAEWPEFLNEKTKEKKKAGRPAKETFNPANPADVARVNEALTYISPDEEERWSQVGWILGRAYRQSDAGFAIYSAWAARSRKYDAKRTRGHYYERSKEIRGSDLKTTASLFAWAVEAGWAPANAEEMEEREFHVFENPFREEAMVQEFIIACSHAPRVFVMDKRLVRIVHYGASGAPDALGIERDPTAYVVWEHDADTIAVELGNIAAFWNRRADGFVRAAFPRKHIQTFISCREYAVPRCEAAPEGAEIKPLIAFVPHPTLRADGTMIEKVGYDPSSRLFLTSSVDGLRVDRGLSQKAAREAMTVLRAPFSEYPWASEVDRAVFCAALFTVGLRHLFDVAPLFAFSSPKHGSGKTQLAECLSRLWYGITLSKATWTPNPEEMEKRIAAFLMAGDRMVCLDNVTEGLRLEDSTLNKVLTSRRNTFRILGKTERVELTNEATWFATGNQLSLSGDIARRALMCYIDAKVADPSGRSFNIPDLPAYVMKNRGALMSAALSIVASWIGAGRPAGPAAHREYGSFNTWYAMIRNLLLWAGEEDIARGIDAVTEEDSEGIALEAFANSLRMTMPPTGERMKLMDVMKLFGKDSALRSAFAGCVIGTITEPNHRSLSDLLRRCENKIFTGDNPGALFTINKRKDPIGNLWMWGYEYMEEKR
jgi:hypothetical protein